VCEPLAVLGLERFELCERALASLLDQRSSMSEGRSIQ
jgi:hypothetical protein